MFLKLTLPFADLCGTSLTISGSESVGCLSLGESSASVVVLSRSIIHQVVIDPLPCTERVRLLIKVLYE